MTRELRISILDLDGRVVFDWRTPREERSPIFGAAVRPGDISRAIFRVRNEDVGPISDLIIGRDARFVVNVQPQRIESLPVHGEVTIAFDFTLPRDSSLNNSGRTSIAFRGVVTGWL